MTVSFLLCLVLFLVAYFLGSIPTGYLIARWLKGIDIRQYGSGSTGATNVLRTLGKGPALVVFVVDVLKGVLAVLAVRLMYWVYPDLIPSSWQDWLTVICALLAIIGHSKSIWLNFTGGKSVATSLGILLSINPLLGLGSFSVFLVVVAIWRIVSLSSIAAAIAVNILTWLLLPSLPYIVFALLAGVYVIFRHRSNIERILAGTEPKIGESHPAQN